MEIRLFLGHKIKCHGHEAVAQKSHDRTFDVGFCTFVSAGLF